MSIPRSPVFLSDSELDANVKALFQEVLRARECWEAWWAMKSRPYRGKYADVFSDYSQYFRVAIHSHFSALVLALWRLYDPGSGTISLLTIRARMGSRPDFTRQAQANYKRIVRSISSFLGSLETIRHKFLAHRDPNYTIERVFLGARLKYGDLRKLVDASLDLVNILLDRRRLRVRKFDNAVTMDTVRILCKLHR